MIFYPHEREKRGRRGGCLQVRKGEGEGSERVRGFGRKRLRRRQQLKLLDESAEVLFDALLLELSGHQEDSS